jgi:hypothetical protein
LSTVFFAAPRDKNRNDEPILENGCQSRFQDRALGDMVARLNAVRRSLQE